MSCSTDHFSLAGIPAVGRKGQGTVEAAFVMPILFLLFLLLIQPTILLYNRMVMENAAAEACRLLATKTSFGNHSNDKYHGYILRRLASIPPIDIFHVSTGETGWTIEFTGDENSGTVSVTITNRVRPLPIIGWGAELLGMLEDGLLVQTVEVTMPTQPAWAQDAEVGSPGSWTEQWED